MLVRMTKCKVWGDTKSKPKQNAYHTHFFPRECHAKWRQHHLLLVEMISIESGALILLLSLEIHRE